MSLKDLFAKNSTKSFLTYEARRASSDVSGSIPALDLYGQVGTYGRADYSLNAVYPSEGFLKDIEEDIYVLNFVADAYHDLKRHFEKMDALDNLATKNTKLRKIKAKAGWKSLTNSHHNYVQIVFDTFFQTYAKNLGSVPLEHFVNTFQRFIRDSKNTFCFTRTSFIESLLYDPLMSGLMIELSDDLKGDDTIKRKYYEDSNFDIYQKILKLYGFKNDKNFPWRIIADIESGPMLKYMEKYGINNKTMFDKYFYKSYELDIAVMKEYFREYYNFHEREQEKKVPAIPERALQIVPGIEGILPLQKTDISKYGDILPNDKKSIKRINLLALRGAQNQGTRTAVGETAIAVPPPPIIITEFGRTFVDCGWDVQVEVTSGVVSCVLGNPDGEGWCVNSGVATSPTFPKRIDPADGSTVWEATHLDGTRFRNHYDLGVLREGVLYTFGFAIDAPVRSWAALDYDDGSLVWRYVGGATSQSGATTYDAANDELIFCGDTNPETANNISDGTLIDVITVSGVMDGRGCVIDGQFVASWGSTLRAYDASPFRNPESLTWSVAINTYTGAPNTSALTNVVPCPQPWADDKGAAGAACVILMAPKSGLTALIIIRVSDGVELGTTDVATDATGTTGFTFVDCVIDRFGHAHVGKVTSDGSISEWLRYDDAGVFVKAQEVTGPNWSTGTNRLERLGVDYNGKVFCINREGYAKAFAQV
jgi:hypothetical protein